MKNTKKRPLIWGVLLLTLFTGSIPFHLKAQNFSIAQVAKNLKEFQKTQAQEKIYLHTDRATYTSGDKVWFKAYLVDSKFHLLINTSASAYVEFIDQQKNVIARRNILLVNGMGSGDFQIPYTQGKGDYILRAYTRYMQNFDAGFFFSKKVKVLDIRDEKPKVSDTNATKKAATATKPSANTAKLDVQFFPEGGYLIDQLVNYVAFKAVNSQGKGVKIQGKIVDSQGKEINKLMSVKFGLGKFVMIPKPNEKYTAVINYKNKEYRFPLTQSKATGYTLRAKSSARYIQVTVQSSKSVNLQKATLFAHVRGYVVTQHTHQGNEPAFVLRIPKEKLPSGILHLTLFDGQGHPQCERLTFVENLQDIHQVKVSSDKSSYNTRAKAKFTLEVKDTQGKPAQGNVSLAIVNAGLEVSPRQKMTIQNYLWLSSDLKGHIENPAYYFNPQYPNRHHVMDLLMMTQGWRRFKWQDVQKNPGKKLPYTYEKGLTISGKLYRFYNRKRTVAGKVKLTFAENLLFNQEIETGKDGRFAFNNLGIQDTVNVILQANKLGKKKKKNQKKDKIKERNDAIFIHLDDAKAQAASIPADYQNIPDFDKIVAQEEEVLKRTKKFNTINVAYGLEPDVKLLDEVQITARRIKEKQYAKRPGQLYQRPSTRLKLAEANADISAAGTFFAYLRGKLPGVAVGERGVIIRGQTTLSGSPEPLYLLDGAPVTADILRDMPLNVISHVDVLNSNEAVIYGNQAVNGVLAVYTKQGVPKAAKRPRWGIINFKHPGYYKSREFYIPKYGKNKSLKNKPDYRRILYWNPSLTLSKKGTANVEFFTSDESTNYRIEIEGVTLDGRLLMGEYRFKVVNED